MRKEVLFAIIFGTIFGLVTAFGVWRLNSSISSKNQPLDDQGSAEPTPSPTSTIGLTVAKPNELAVLRDVKANIEGITKAGSWVVASGETKDFITKAGSDSSFNIEAELIGGLNQVQLSSFNSDNDKFELILPLIYSSNFPSSESSSASPSPDSSPTDSIREKVEDKIKETQNAPTAYIGSITDISESTLNIKNSKDEIQQVAIEEGVTYTNDITKKEVKFNDLAIGDFIIAMGYRNSNHVLHAKRIVVTNKPTPPKRKVYLGKVSDIISKVLTLELTEENVELTFPKNWKGPEIKEIAEDDLVIVVANTSEKNEIRTIEIVK